MFIKILKHELGSIKRDKMYSFFVGYLLLFFVVSIFLFPYLKDQPNPESTILMVFILFLLMNGFIFGAITGFTLLDNKDDNVLLSLQVTPIDVNMYIFFKLLICFIFSLISTTLLVFIANISSSISVVSFIMTIFLASLQGPIIALIMNVFASNKVEGFVVMKISGLLLIGPILSLFLTDWTEFFIGLFPGFWPSRILTMDFYNSSYTFSSPYIYFILGLFVNGLFILNLLNFYKKKNNLS